MAAPLSMLQSQFNGCFKIASTPFPAAYVQMNRLLRFVFCFTLPFFLAPKLGWIVVPLASLFAVGCDRSIDRSISASPGVRRASLSGWRGGVVEAFPAGGGGARAAALEPRPTARLRATREARVGTHQRHASLSRFLWRGTATTRRYYGLDAAATELQSPFVASFGGVTLDNHFTVGTCADIDAVLSASAVAQ